MFCSVCTEEPLLEHRDGEMLRGYCPRCGATSDICRDTKRERWTPEQRAKLTKQGVRNLPQKGNKKRRY